MKNYLEAGDNVVVASPEAADSGEFLVKGALSGVAAAAADNGADVVLKRKGVFELPKATGTAWTQGDRLYWDASAKNFTKTAANNQPMGVAFDAALSGDTVGSVLLDPPAGGFKMACGEAALDGSNPTPITTGLTTCIAAIAQLKGSVAPGDNTSVLTCVIGTADFDVHAWKNTGGTDPTLVASTGTESFYWIAFGI